MGQAGAQREPSMEEILASIRRIIENNETELPSQGLSGQPEDDSGLGGSAESDFASDAEDDEEADEETDGEADRRAALSPSADDHGSLEIFPTRDAAPRAEAPAIASVADRPADGRAELAALQLADASPDDARQPDSRPSGSGLARSGVTSADHADSAAADSRPVSLADVAARMRSEPSTPVNTVLDDAAVAELQTMFDDEAVNLQPQDRVKGPADESPRAAPRVPEEPKAGEAAPSQVSSQVSGPVSGPNQLISVDAGVKVAASFEALNEAVAAGSVRSFDQIAEELLRPMLQSWLDDNLPTLVERLVREEIERVSRGPRR